ncbi:hypothetical protein [Brevibacillus laterosporus]|uniref:Uncharacterized protein n=1 Tax=Brevibacillus laterosporus TaxID=1465 RepID=A0AAP3DFN3_BRELA|nr:hypothetical protein [Brevibacillus laterosporus]MCR8980046.1 hypothetical protein [Brevibacillus laterosporus]MCZ0807201.1 hypothetical protein [Brevibacillus laterosporus]MCZ0825402.1 hypothetical protein [Brevibacillus laterosporus]MCZ0849179.1 hypothetical protein [Brevibacillus laterosporus]
MDKKAKQIVMKTFWNSTGWIDRESRSISDEDFAYAKSKGLMFEPLTITHDECVQRLIDLHQIVTKEQVAKAFLHSLSTRKLHLRSALSSWILTHQLPQHAFESNAGKYATINNGSTYAMFGDCYICDGYHVASLQAYKNEDLNVLNFERIKWGGIRLNHIVYNLLDLELLIKEEDIEVQAEDVEIFRRVMETISSCEPTDAARQLEKRLKGVLPSSKNERDALLEILATAGILISSKDRPGRGGKNDFFAIVNWRGEDGYAAQAVHHYFSHWL